MPDNDNIIDLGPHSNLTPEQALAIASRETWTDIMIIGFKPDRSGVVTRSSSMTRETANWILDKAKLWALDDGD